MTAYEMVQCSNHPARYGALSRSSRPSAVLVGFFAGLVPWLAGCGSVAGPEYTGEVGLELRGEVVSLDDDQAGLIPALWFWGEDGMYLVTGEVTGQFPKQFGLRVDEPPPEGALRKSPSFGETKVGAAFLVMVPADHPRVLPHEEGLQPTGFSHSSDQSEPDPETGMYTSSETTCWDETGECETLNYSCTQSACETLLVEERKRNEILWGSGIECAGLPCLTFEAHCLEDLCTREIHYCERANEEESAWSDGNIHQCSLVSREGALPVSESSIDIFAKDLMVVFSTERVKAEGVQFEQGYNLIRGANPDKHAWAKSKSCELDAESRVMNDPAGYTEEELLARVREAQRLCPRVQTLERVANPGDQQLRISLGAPTPLL